LTTSIPGLNSIFFNNLNHFFYSLFTSSPFPLLPGEKGVNRMIFMILAPPPRGRGWGEVKIMPLKEKIFQSACKNSLLLHNKNKIYADFFFFRKYVVFLQTPK
jgi:hypothetical protein